VKIIDDKKDGIKSMAKKQHSYECVKKHRMAKEQHPYECMRKA
jgi:hypothetical protein